MFTKTELIDSVLNGIIDANDFFEKITTGSWLNDAGVESVLQTKIAESVFDFLPKNKDKSLSEAHILMEVGFSEIIDRSGSDKKRGRIPNLVRGSKRVDILVCDKNEAPLVPIEVKRNASTLGFAEDAARILSILGRSDRNSGGSVKYGLICGFLFGNGGSQSEAIEMLKHKKAMCIEYLTDKIPKQYFEFYYKDDGPKEYDDPDDEDASVWWVGGAVCVYLRRKI